MQILHRAVLILLYHFMLYWYRVILSHLISYRVERRVLRRHADHRMRPSLPRGPLDFPDVQSFGEADFTPNAVCALRHRVAVESQFVILLQKFKKSAPA